MSLLSALLLALLLWGSTVRPSAATTWTAASCSPTDVGNAIALASGGDTVQLPACDFTNWNVTLNISKAITLQGMGTAATILHRVPGAALNMFQLNGTTGFRMTALTLEGSYDTNPNVYADIGLLIFDAVDFRIHHMAFQNLSRGIQLHGDPNAYRGVIDHNTFTDIYYSDGSSSYGYGVVPHGNGGYPTLSLGTAQNIFVEDNVFYRNRHNISLNNGGRYVFRHNIIHETREQSAAVDVHGRGAWPTGGRQYETYNNIIYDEPNRLFGGFGIRGGDGVIFNNQIANTIDQDTQLEVEQGCGGSYPQPDQIRDLSLWGNTYIEGGVIDAPTIYCPTLTQANRDFWNVTASFTGATGVGVGVIASRPSTCTTGVGYWATDEGEWDSTHAGADGRLYRCTATNTWTLSYTPYTYPHPLAVSGTPPTVTITAPNSGNNTTVASTPLTTLAGTATDDVGVTSLSWSCPTCTPPSATITCPGANCTGSATNWTWSVASIGLRLGGNPITVTATDGEGGISTDSILVTLDGPANYTSNLLSYWTLDNVTTDSGTNAQPGTLIGTPSYDSAGNCKVSTCLLLDGTSQYMFVAQAGKYALHAMPFTIAAWVKDDTSAATLESLHHRLVVWHDGTNGIGIGLGGATTAPGARRFFYVQNRAAANGYEQASGSVGTGWHHLVATFDGLTSYQTYVDGVLSEATEATAPGIAPTDTTLYIGGVGFTGTYLAGAIDDVRIYNRELRAIDITALYTSQTTGPVAPVVLRLVK